MEGRLADCELLGNLGDRGPGAELGLRLTQLSDDLLWSVSAFPSSRVLFLLLPCVGGRILIVTGSVFGEQIIAGIDII